MSHVAHRGWIVYGYVVVILFDERPSSPGIVGHTHTRTHTHLQTFQ